MTEAGFVAIVGILAIVAIWWKAVDSIGVVPTQKDNDND